MDRQLVFEDDFDGSELDRGVWLPHYFPAWSSRAATKATYELKDSQLWLTIPIDQGLWCEQEHPTPLRVSGIQSGNYSGPVGSTQGQQPFRDGLVVREAQDTFWGWTPEYGRLEIRLRGEVTQRSMVGVWMIGLEDRPERCGEILLNEVFGESVKAGESCEVGVGLRPFRDPDVADAFTAPRLAVDVADFHTYAVEWTAERADFFVDDEQVHTSAKPPRYPMQMEIAVFDFPDKSTGDDHDAVPALVVDWVRQYA
ncbi:glycoside hydrolase family 16 protein [Tenggerimyces flavus]|uniref:Glycoside hydrolase family 16 protein n=1 Tax=Tenggerimyces flavus TaxID=1708749 RepID=A0ABV7YQH0_9ACTN|nr:glycoside hydrolase family 16 protein [Tenggerimyces flavus]MBM7784963.1 hypothetical protein [Tenggerimyces flavus]